MYISLNGALDKPTSKNGGETNYRHEIEADVQFRCYVQSSHGCNAFELCIVTSCFCIETWSNAYNSSALRTCVSYIDTHSVVMLRYHFFDFDTISILH